MIQDAKRLLQQNPSEADVKGRICDVRFSLKQTSAEWVGMWLCAHKRHQMAYSILPANECFA
jgi:hypothetical protein